MAWPSSTDDANLEPLHGVPVAADQRSPTVHLWQKEESYSWIQPQSSCFTQPEWENQFLSQVREDLGRKKKKKGNLDSKFCSSALRSCRINRYRRQEEEINPKLWLSALPCHSQPFPHAPVAPGGSLKAASKRQHRREKRDICCDCSLSPCLLCKAAAGRCWVPATVNFGGWQPEAGQQMNDNPDKSFLKPLP